MNLLYVNLQFSGRSWRALVDTGATHNYMAKAVVEKLALDLEYNSPRDVILPNGTALKTSGKVRVDCVIDQRSTTLPISFYVIDMQ